MNVTNYQRDCCHNYGVAFNPPQPDQLVFVSDGFYDPAQRVEGTRMKPRNGFCGWVLTTLKHDGNPASLVQVHFHHVVERRPDLAVYMALPPGSSFLLGSQHDHVRFESVPSLENAPPELA